MYVVVDWCWYMPPYKGGGVTKFWEVPKVQSPPGLRNIPGKRGVNPEGIFLEKIWWASSEETLLFPSSHD